MVGRNVMVEAGRDPTTSRGMWRSTSESDSFSRSTKVAEARKVGLDAL